MRSCGSFVLVLAFVVLASADTTHADSIRIDQSATTASSIGSAFGQCCDLVAQVFTAGVTGHLVAISVDITEEPDHHYPLWLLLEKTRRDEFGRDVPEDKSTLSVAYAYSGSTTLSDVLQLTHPFDQVAGQTYAIVAFYPGAPVDMTGSLLAIWHWSGDYPRGYPLSAVPGFGEREWITGLGGDNRFITYVSDTSAVPEPATLLLFGGGLGGVVVRRRFRRTRFIFSQDVPRLSH